MKLKPLCPTTSICYNMCVSVCLCVPLSSARLGLGTTNAKYFIWEKDRIGVYCALIGIGIRMRLKLLRIASMGT
jgi:hypothetical protein